MSVMSAPVAESGAAAEGRGRFHGTGREYFSILARDTLALVVTLGMYRFWVATNMRRYLWSRTDLAGEQLDYTGDPIELLLGFLVLVVVLAPLVVVFAILSIASGEFGLVRIATYAPIVLLALLAVLALYQARRYRVNHTVLRGLRFRQTGSAWVYVLLIAFWTVVGALTLGLAYPWARASLERYKMRHTFYGDLQASFDGSAWELFKRGFLLWLVVWGPFLASLFVPSEVEDVAGLVAMIWVVSSGLVLYPFFRAIALRWRIAGIRLGTLTLASDFPVWSFAKAYVKFYASLALLAAVVGALGLVALLVIAEVARSTATEVIGVILLVIAYFLIATLVSFSYQATVRLETWKLIADSLVLRGVDQLDRAKAPPQGTSRRRGRIGAALNLGGF
jgi:uncharacterized membrane protein YjgN (DUF898 family)